MAFRPGWVPTLVMVAGVLTTASLCVWQLNRHAEKQALKDEILSRLQEPVLDEDALAENVDDLLYRKIEVEGQWAEPQVLTAGRTPLVSESLRLPKAGYGVVQAFTVDSGLTLMVDRGWVPRDTAAEVLADMDTPGARITLTGQLRPLDGEDIAGPTPGREGLPPIWPPGSWPAIWESLPTPKVRAVVLAGQPLLAGEGANPDVYPIGDYKPLPRMRDSLSYAGQWALFGTILLIVWVAFGISRGRQVAD